MMVGDSLHVSMVAYGHGMPCPVFRDAPILYVFKKTKTVAVCAA